MLQTHVYASNRDAASRQREAKVSNLSCKQHQREASEQSSMKAAEGGATALSIMKGCGTGGVGELSIMKAKLVQLII